MHISTGLLKCLVFNGHSLQIFYTFQLWIKVGLEGLQKIFEIWISKRGYINGIWYVSDINMCICNISIVTHYE